MWSVLMLVHGTQAACFPASDMTQAGLRVIGELTECHKLVQGVAQHLPDVVPVVVVQTHSLDDRLLAALQTLGETASCPVLLLTPDADAARMAKALQAGVHAWLPTPPAVADWPMWLQLARARHAHEQGLVAQWRDATAKLEERKTVERAKGLLMRGRDVTDDDAFRILRNASMHTNQRLSQVSQHVIDAAQSAEAVNRAGQLRMLSQRLVKLHVLRLAEPSVRAHKQAFEESVKRVDDNLTWLAQAGSVSTSGVSALTDDALVAISVAWLPLKAVLQARADHDGLPQVEQRAERFLEQAELLTGVLERDGQVATLKVLNVAGRQRMLSQRFAKLALVHLLQVQGIESDGGAAMTQVQTDFEQALAYLNGLPLTTTPIREALDAAQADWQHMLTTVAGAGRVTGRDLAARLHVVANASEALLAGFEQLSTQYERSMHMLMG